MPTFCLSFYIRKVLCSLQSKKESSTFGSCSSSGTSRSSCISLWCVTKDQSEAVFAYAQLRVYESNFPAPMKFLGLSPDKLYRVRVSRETWFPRTLQIANPPWLDAIDGLGLTCAELAKIGLRLSILSRANAILMEVIGIS